MRTKSTFAAPLCLFCLLPALASAQVYSVTDLGPLAPTAINTWGQVVGNLNGHAFIWTKSQGRRNLGTLAGGTFSSAAGVNDSGVVTGTADGPGTVISPDPSFPNQTCSDLTQPFTWTRTNGMQGLGTVGIRQLYPNSMCGIPFYATGINGGGQVVGYDGTGPDLYQFAFLWTSTGGMTLFGSGWPPTAANGVNQTGQIVGQNDIPFDYNAVHATSWQNGVATDLGTLGGGADVTDYSSSAGGGNDVGQVVGWSSTTSISYFSQCYQGTDCPMHAVLWTPVGTISDLGTLSGDTFSAALKINFFGVAIGSSGNTIVLEGPLSVPQVVGRPFVWSANKGMQDLNTLIRGHSGWVLNSVSDINVWGQIVGLGTVNGQSHGFLLTPKKL